jgi:3-oxoacyl-[acyl-carrier-protein] synthase II
MMRMTVKGIGVVGGFGCGVAELSAALESGTTNVETLSVPTAAGKVEIPAYRARTGRLEEFAPKRALRRIDHYSKLGLLGAYLALEDGGMLGSDPGRLGVVIASGYGATATTFAFLDSIIADGDICASPTHFANSVHNSAAANISIMLGAKGPSLTVSQFEMSLPSALLTARLWLSEGRVDAVLVGAIDELSDLVGYLWHRQRGVGNAQAISPLDFDRESSILGEGAAFLLLTRDGEGYCGIDDVETGSLGAGTIPVASDSLLLLGADGRKEFGARYRELAGSSPRVACYSPLYGSMPAAAGFDLASAALSLKNGRGVPMAGDGIAGTSAVDRISAIRVAGADEYSAITLSL